MGKIYKIKSSLVLVMLVFLSLAVVACSSSPDAQEEAGTNIESDSALNKVALEVPTLFWPGCWPRVEASAKGVPGVMDVKFDRQTVIVTYDPAQTTSDAIVDTIERRGDRVTKVTKLWNRDQIWKYPKPQTQWFITELRVR